MTSTASARLTVTASIVLSVFLGLSGRSAEALPFSWSDATQLINIFTNGGFLAPVVTINNTERTLDISILGKLIDHTIADNTSSIDTAFALDFWRGTMVFSQVDGQTGPDSITVSGSVFHQAGIDRPDPGDVLKGGIFTLKATTITGASQAGGFDKTTEFGDTVAHDMNHSDHYFGSLQASGPVNDPAITGWTLIAKGEHLMQPVPEPATLLLFGTTAVGYGFARWRQRRRRQS